MLTFAGCLWSQVVAEVVAPSSRMSRCAYQHIDAATIHMVTDPGRFDVIVTDNLFGDIITDLSGAGAAVSAWPPAAISMRRGPNPVDVRTGARQRA